MMTGAIVSAPPEPRRAVRTGGSRHGARKPARRSSAEARNIRGSPGPSWPWLVGPPVVSDGVGASSVVTAAAAAAAGAARVAPHQAQPLRRSAALARPVPVGLGRSEVRYSRFGAHGNLLRPRTAGTGDRCVIHPLALRSRHYRIRGEPPATCRRTPDDNRVRPRECHPDLECSSQVTGSVIGPAAKATPTCSEGAPGEDSLGKYAAAPYRDRLRGRRSVSIAKMPLPEVKAAAVSRRAVVIVSGLAIVYLSCASAGRGNRAATAPHAATAPANSPQQDCEALMNMAFSFAERLLSAHREFFPFGAAMSPAGKIMAVGGQAASEHADAADVVAVLENGLREGAARGQYKATALVVDVQVVPPGKSSKQDGVAVRLDHRGGYSVVMVFPYSFSDSGKFVVEDRFCGFRERTRSSRGRDLTSSVRRAVVTPRRESRGEQLTAPGTEIGSRRPARQAGSRGRLRTGARSPESHASPATHRPGCRW